MTMKLRIAFGIPAYGGHITVEQAQMWLAIGNTLSASPERFELAGMFYLDSQPIDRVRNRLVKYARAAQADWLCMIDADTFVLGDESGDAGFYVLRMISDADRAHAAIVGAPVALRGAEDLLAVYREPVDQDMPVVLRVVEGPQQMYEAHAVGTGCVAINLHSEAVLRFDEAPFEFTPKLSEDLNFCRRVRDTGSKILVDGRITTGHMSRSKPLYSRKVD